MAEHGKAHDHKVSIESIRYLHTPWRQFWGNNSAFHCHPNRCCEQTCNRPLEQTKESSPDRRCSERMPEVSGESSESRGGVHSEREVRFGPDSFMDVDGTFDECLRRLTKITTSAPYTTFTSVKNLIEKLSKCFSCQFSPLKSTRDDWEERVLDHDNADHAEAEEHVLVERRQVRDQLTKGLEDKQMRMNIDNMTPHKELLHRIVLLNRSVTACLAVNILRHGVVRCIYLWITAAGKPPPRVDGSRAPEQAPDSNTIQASMYRDISHKT